LRKEEIKQSVWEQLKGEVRGALINKAKTRGIITYGELTNQITTMSFDFEDPSHRDLIGQVLGEITEEEAAAGRGLLSSIVVHKHNDMEPGAGFFGLAEHLGYDTKDKTTCWAKAIKEVHKIWA